MGCARFSEKNNFRDYLVDPLDIVTLSPKDADLNSRIWEKWVYSKKKVYVESKHSSENSKLLHLSQLSTIFGFIDDTVINLTFDPVLKRYKIYVHSELRLGKSDLGVNPQRLASIYKCIKENMSPE